MYRPTSGVVHDWFVFFSVYDEFTGKMRRFRKKEGFAACKTDQQRARNAARLKKKYTDKLMAGWNPLINDKEVIWEDHLAYADIKKHLPMQRSKRTIPFYMAAFLKDAEKRLAKGTYDDYKSKFRIFRKYLDLTKTDAIDVSVFTEEQAKGFIDFLINKKKLSGKTINQYIILVRQLWKFAGGSRKFLGNPFSNIPKMKENSTPQVPLKRGVIQLLKAELEATDRQLWLAAQFMYYCFIRPKELRFMQIKHLDLYEGRITLYSNITKTGKSRTVDVHSDFLSRLFNDYQLHQFPEDFYVFSLAGQPGPKPVGKNYFWNHFNKVRKRLNLPREYKFYSFKHTGAVAALKAGADIKEIQHQMGHSSVAITDEYLKSMVGYESDFFRKKMPEL